MLRRIEISSTDEYYHKLLYEFKILNRKKTKNTFTINPSFGKGYAERTVIGNSLEICVFSASFNEEFYYSCLNKRKSIELFFCGKGNYEYGIYGKGLSIKSKKGHINTFVNNDYESWIKYPRAEEWNNVSISFGDEFLKKYQDISGEEIPKKSFSEIMYKGIPEHFQTSATVREMTLSFQNIIECTKKGALRVMYLESKAIELISDFIDLYQNIENNHENFRDLCKYDLKKLEYARKVIERHLQNPLTINQLSDSIGLNTFKLKKGFKQVYGTTIYGYLRDLRMRKALSLMSSNEKIIDIANEVGYSNPSHFAAAFRKKYGINPKEYLKRYKNTF